MTGQRRHRDESFRSFFLAESERLRRLGIFLTGDPDRSADLAQEAMARTYRHWNRIHETDPGPYARRILVNLVRSSHRRSLLARKHLQLTPQVTDSKTPHVDDYLRIMQALKELPPIRRAAVVLRFYEDMTESEIAHTLDRPLGTVKSDIHRGLRKLREVLEETARESA